MIKKKSTGVIFALIFLGVIFILVKINNQQIHYTNDTYCAINDGQCQITKNGQVISLQMSPANIPLEEEITLKFTLPNELIVNQAWVTGINMYMGKTPVIIESVAGNVTQAVTFLGSCSEPHMQWLLSLDVENRQTHQQQRLYFRFTTQNE
ncbi:hypothetical protein [Neptunicella sp.]|uniref:hypothetical protein n=1 Tax=Neptunicella sp. TaxID=2125986 RepID=UPI003F6901BA